jgi:hypothetical protein
MKVRYFNCQDNLDPLHGTVIAESAELEKMLEDAKRKPPFIAELHADNGFEVSIGICENYGWFQYSNLDGNPPYLNAMSPQRPLKRGFVEFLDANTPTPIPARYIISFDELKSISIHFFRTGRPSSVVSWEDFDPEAIREAKAQNE